MNSPYKNTIEEYRKQVLVLNQRNDLDYSFGKKHFASIELINFNRIDTVENMKKYFINTKLSLKQKGAVIKYIENKLKKDYLHGILIIARNALVFIKKKGAKIVIPIPQDFILKSINEYGGRCLPLTRMMAVAITDLDAKPDYLVRNLYAATSEKNERIRKYIKNGLASLHSSSSISAQGYERNIGRFKLDKITELLSSYGDVIFNLNSKAGVIQHAMLVGKKGENYFFYDPNSFFATFSDLRKMTYAIKEYIFNKRTNYYKILNLELHADFEFVQMDYNRLATLTIYDGLRVRDFCSKKFRLD